MTAIVFRTPGTIDMRSFTTMGVNAKPNSTKPIGYFGTGLKYAVAVLTRLGASFEVYTDGRRYWFETTPMTFRGSEFNQITMRRDNWTGGYGWTYGRRLKLPFTTQYGRNWEAWMAFRELYSNTLDEGGEAWTAEGAVPDFEDSRDYEDSKGHTYIVVSNCPAFVEAYNKRGDIFINLGERKLLKDLGGVEVREGAGKQLFYQGLRAKDVQKPTLLTYNFTSASDLTEDRQLAHEYQVRSSLANAIARSDDIDLIERIITAKDENWEHGLAPDPWVQPSDAFKRVMARRPSGVGYGWGGYYTKHDDRPEVVRSNLWDDALRPWKVDGDTVQSADEKELFSKPYDMNKNVWALLAARLCEVAAGGDPDAPFGRVEMIEEDLWPEGEGPFAPRDPLGGLRLTTVPRDQAIAAGAAIAAQYDNILDVKGGSLDIDIDSLLPEPELDDGLPF